MPSNRVQRNFNERSLQRADREVNSPQYILQFMWQKGLRYLLFFLQNCRPPNCTSIAMWFVECQLKCCCPGQEFHLIELNARGLVEWQMFEGKGVGSYFPVRGVSTGLSMCLRCSRPSCRLDKIGWHSRESLWILYQTYFSIIEDAWVPGEARGAIPTIAIPWARRFRPKFKF